MLRALDIRDILIIDRLALEFQPGLNVLTGETGAGKSILLDSLGFVLGWRGRAELVRSGADQGEVVAVFDLSADHPALDVLDDAGFGRPDELILRRTNTADGRKTAWINDRRCSGQVLRDVSAHLVELHGQHDDRGLLNPRGHRALLDIFAGAEPQISKTRAAWRSVAQARKALADARASVAAAQADEDFLRHAVAELEALAPQEGEEAQLDTRRRMMQSAEKVRDDISRAAELLGGQGAERTFAEAIRWLDDAAPQVDGLLDAPLAALARAAVELGEAQDGVLVALDQLSFNPSELEESEERLFAIRAMTRKHGVVADDLPSLAATLSSKLHTLDSSADQISGLTQSLAHAEEIYATQAAALTALRKTSARSLDQAMAAELAPLKMERAVFVTQVNPTDPGPDGCDEVAFMVATNPGAPAGALNKIASGGELSRFLLALKVCLAHDDSETTMIFDEIDRGVGGATADAVGRRLADLSAGGQVLVVTHSPQVAALGAHHWRVEKRVDGEMTTSTVVPLGADDRVEELARMLAGDRITPEARAAAQALLQS